MSGPAWLLPLPPAHLPCSQSHVLLLQRPPAHTRGPRPAPRPRCLFELLASPCFSFRRFAKQKLEAAALGGKQVHRRPWRSVCVRMGRCGWRSSCAVSLSVPCCSCKRPFRPLVFARPAATNTAAWGCAPPCHAARAAAAAPAAQVLDLKLHFDEAALLRENLPYLTRSLKLEVGGAGRGGAGGAGGALGAGSGAGGLQGACRACRAPAPGALWPAAPPQGLGVALALPAACVVPCNVVRAYDRDGLRRWWWGRGDSSSS